MTKHCQRSVARSSLRLGYSFTIGQVLYCRAWILEGLSSSSQFQGFFSCNPSYITLYSDASDVACGGHILGKDIFAYRIFTNAERTQNERRVLRIVNWPPSYLFWRHCAPFLSSSGAKWFTDNQGAARILQVGSMHFELHLLASDIFSFCYNHGINLEIDWAPRSLKEKADYLGKKIVPEIFQLLDSRWGPHTVDCFATFYNSKVPRFLPRFWNPGSSGVTHVFKPGKGKTIGWFH